MLKTVGLQSTRTGDQTIINGNEVISTVGKGVNFTANTPAAGMTSQLMNWYEEGTWTPVVAATAGSITSYTVNSATYTRIGRCVVLNFDYTITNNGTGGSATTISGMPFNVAGGANAAMGTVREVAVVGLSGVVYPGSTTSLTVINYTNGYLGGTNYRVVGSITYNA